MTGIDRSPTRTGSAVAVLTALVALAAGGAFSWIALGLGGVGVVLLGTGIALARHDGVSLGAAALFVGVLAAGVEGAPVVALLVGAVATVVAWDSAGTAIDLGAQLGRESPTRRLELVHAGGTAVVGGLAATAGWSIYQISLGSTPLTGPVFLLVAALCLAGALAARDGSAR